MGAAHPELSHPLRRLGNRSFDAPPNDEKGDQCNEKGLDRHAEEGVAPDPATLSFNMSRIMKDGERPYELLLLMQGENVKVHKRLAEGEKLPAPRVLGDRLGDGVALAAPETRARDRR